MRLIVPDLSSVAGGVETMCCALFPEFARSGCEVFWVLPSHRIPWLQSRAGAADGLSFVAAEWPWRCAFRWFDAGARRLARWKVRSANALRAALFQKRLRALCGGVRAQSAFFPWILDSHPPRLPVLMYCVLLDRNWEHFPGNFRQSPQALDQRVAAWLEHSAGGFAISEFARREWLDRRPADEAKIEAIPLAAPGDLPLPGYKPAARHRFQFYYPATVAAHKNHLALFQAAAKLVAHGYAIDLVLTGHGTETLIGDARPAAPVLREIWEFYQARRSLLEGKIQCHSYLPRAQQLELLTQIDCVVLPSRYEGFGLPLIEALACGVPVVASDIAAHAEQIEFHRAHEVTSLFPASEVEALEEAMRGVMDHRRPPGAALVEVANRVRQWTWAKVAAAYLKKMSAGKHAPTD